MDIYTYGAALVFGKPECDVSENERHRFKNAFLLAAYAAGKHKQLDALMVDFEERKKIEDAKH